MQSDRKKISTLASDAERSALEGARMERPQLSGPPQGRDPAPVVTPATPSPSPQELLHTSFSFETPRATIQESAQRVTAERIRQIRSTIAVRTRQTSEARNREHPETAKISVSHGETILDRLMAWVALSLKSLELRLFRKPAPLPKKSTSQPDREKERREREARAREHLKRAMKIRRADRKR